MTTNEPGGRDSGARPGARIVVDDVSKVFDTPTGSVTALDRVALEVDEGEFVCVLGPSGCGKTTLLRMMAALERPSGGQIRIRHGDPERALSAVVFQDYSVFPWKTARANVMFPLQQMGMSRADAGTRADEWLVRLDLGGFERAYPDALSGGMKQRVAIARALATRPELLLMDEPLAALDAQLRLLLQEQLLDLWQAERSTVVFVTHSIDEALLLGDRVVMMTARPGRIHHVLDVPFDRPRHADTIRRSTEFADLREDLWLQLKREIAP